MKACSLFKQPQLKQLEQELQVDRKPEAGTATGHFEGASQCDLSQSDEPWDTFNVLLVTTEGAQVWLSGERNVDAWPVTVGDYPAVSYKLAGGEGKECSTAVDVADGQQLMVDLFPLQNDDQDELCRKTELVAATALDALKKRQ